MIDLRQNLIERRMVELDPALAKHYLTFNTYAAQRPVRKPHVSELAEKMTNGLFRFGEVAFVSMNGKKDIQTNGQHICLAVIESNVTVPCMLERFSVEDDCQLSEVFRQFEILPRSLRDMVAVEAVALKIKWPLKVSSIVVTAAIMEVVGQRSLYPPTGMSARTQKGWMSREDRVKLLGKYMEEGAFIAEIFTFNGAKRSVEGVKHLQRAAVVYIMMKTWRISQSDAKIFWTRVRDGENLKKTMPEMKIREFLLLSRLTGRAPIYTARGITSHEYASRCALAWNAFRTKKSTNLNYRQTSPIPKVI